MAEKQLLTSSRMAKLLSCPRAHYWRYECALQSAMKSDALRFGTAWHTAMEARWKGSDIETALTVAIGDRTEVSEFQVAMLAGLLAGYYSRWACDPVTDLQPEIEFRHSIDGSRSFDSGGKIDGLGTMDGGRMVLMEHKTTSANVEPDSDYWLLLRANQQCLQYVIAARELGWDVSTVFYDVTKKPGMSLRSAIPVLDENGCKVVNGLDGLRVFKKDNTPRESGDKEKGYILQTRPETCEEFAERLAADAKARPEYYFARREMPILEDDIEEFKTQRLELGKHILELRQAEKRVKRPEQAWPRNLSRMTCKNCEYACFCLQNTAVNLEQPPAGFRVGEIHEELEQITQGETL